nr:reverse transcriptase domain-containing protein [Tanacetum cinerariifolium]
LTPTCMTLELINRSISHPVGVVEDVYVKVGSFHFSADFVVVDFDVDHRVPLILGRSFLKTGRALIDVFEGELTLRVGKEAITFNLDQTSRYSANYNDMMAKQIDVIDMACEEYSQEVLGFSDVIVSGNPTPYYDPIVSTTSPTLTPFGNSDFLLEEVDTFLALEDDPTSMKVDQSYLDYKGDILLLEAFFNDDPSLPPPNQGNYLLEVHKELIICEAKSDKSSIDEPSERGEYDIWAMKMQNFISSSDLLCWNIVLKGNSAKSMTIYNDGNLKIRPPVTAEEHQQVQREEKARTILLSALLDKHMGDFYHIIDARDIWNAIKARFGGNTESKKMQKSLLKQKFEKFKIYEEEGLDKGYEKMQKILTQMNTLKIKPE